MDLAAGPQQTLADRSTGPCSSTTCLTVPAPTGGLECGGGLPRGSLKLLLSCPSGASSHSCSSGSCSSSHGLLSLPQVPGKWAQPHVQQPQSSLWQDAHIAICPQTGPLRGWHRGRALARAGPAPGRTRRGCRTQQRSDRRRRGGYHLPGQKLLQASAFCWHLPLSLLSTGAIPSDLQAPASRRPGW